MAVVGSAAPAPKPMMTPGGRVPRVGAQKVAAEHDVVDGQSWLARGDLLFSELTWSPITQPDKDLLAFEKEQEYVLRRASANQAARSFVNDIAPDPLAYAG